MRDLVVDLDINILPIFAHMLKGWLFSKGVRVQTDDSDSKMSKPHKDSRHVVSSTRFIAAFIGAYIGVAGLSLFCNTLAG